MKRAIALLFVFALLLVIVAPSGFGVNTVAVNVSSHSFVWADGGAPIPPFPDIASSNSTAGFWADGGAPIPPFPDIASSNSTAGFWADGGAPIPPFPDIAPSFTGV